MDARTRWVTGEVTVERAEDYRGPLPYIALMAENVSDPQESVKRHLTPAEARQLAAELTRLADAIEREGRD
jgi:hypothetical protein